MQYLVIYMFVILSTSFAEDPELDYMAYEVDQIEEAFNRCLHASAFDMEKYDTELSNCVKSINSNDPKTIKKWQEMNCKDIEKTGYPKCYNMAFNEVYENCIFTYPYTIDNAVIAMKIKYKEICKLKIKYSLAIGYSGFSSIQKFHKCLQQRGVSMKKYEEHSIKCGQILNDQRKTQLRLKHTA